MSVFELLLHVEIASDEVEGRVDAKSLQVFLGGALKSFCFPDHSGYSFQAIKNPKEKSLAGQAFHPCPG